MAEASKTVKEIDVFYHALYHHVAHWAAYVAMMGLLVTVGILSSLTPPAADGIVIRKAGLIVGTVAAALGALYFIQGMNTYGGIINTEYLPRTYLDKVSTIPHKLMIVVGAFAALALCGWDVWIIAML